MNHALVLNAMIVVVVLVGLIVTSNPLFILGLLLMNGLPFGLLAGHQMPDDGDDEEQPMGFTADLK